MDNAKLNFRCDLITDRAHTGGRPLIAAYRAHKSGHALNNRLLRALLAQRAAFEMVSFEHDLPAPGGPEGYAFERNLGFAPWLVKAGTHPVYSGEVVYTGGKVNRYHSTAPPFVGQGPAPRSPPARQSRPSDRSWCADRAD